MAHETIRIELPENPWGITAALIEREDGGPVRPIATGRRRRPVGCYYSFKCGQAFPWESRTELLGIYHAEVRFDVVEYKTQPHTLEMFHEGKKFKYTPDLEHRLSDGRTEIVEIKAEFDALIDPNYTTKLEIARDVYAAAGKSFRVIEQGVGGSTTLQSDRGNPELPPHRHHRSRHVSDLEPLQGEG